MLRYTFSGAAFSAIIVSGFTGFEATLFTFPIHWKPMAVLAFVLIFPAGGSLRLGEQADNPKREGGKRTAQGYTRQRTYP